VSDCGCESHSPYRTTHDYLSWSVFDLLTQSSLRLRGGVTLPVTGESGSHSESDTDFELDLNSLRLDGLDWSVTT